MPLPLAVPIIAGGLGIASSVRGGRKAKRGAEREAEGYGRMADEADRRAGLAGRTAGQSRNSLLAAAYGVRDFDPTQAMTTSAGAMMNQIGDQYNSAVNARNANNNARGMFNSGMGQGRLQKGLRDTVAQGISGLALQGANMRQGALSEYARYIAGLYDTDTAQQNSLWNAAMGLRGSQIGARAAGDQASADMWGQIGGSLVGAAGGTLPYVDSSRWW